MKEKVMISFDDKYVIYYPSRKKLVNDIDDILDMIDDNAERRILAEDLLDFLLGKIDEIFWYADRGNIECIWMAPVTNEHKVLYENRKEIILETNLYDYWDILTGKKNKEV